ncbi:SPRY-domain-containing protein [Basidiobolus meristosporus CBS 931.73]|uniref:SPRY-domain-containing protein n=1 Tax=Basidiobolus meristosporus CBS 931.73 TaxID=1314790 RepID=A0A1Y1YSN8_9FUNG|nr:SPRY-domain-containing protein [Basidiobolus meristosporus CBS 931.73]|eukprot:ORY00767.1 SPRY-domain-containing protein [Basidiobolus meristosporus CBS 931.73]
MNPDSEKEALSEASDILIALSQEESEFIEIVLTMVEILDENDPLTSAFICHILELSALPSVDASLKINARLIQIINERLKKRYRINAAVAWSILAERLAGKVSEQMFTPDVFVNLINGLKDTRSWRVQMMSLIALEKFALAAGNKSKILASEVPSIIKEIPIGGVHSKSKDPKRLDELKLCTLWATKCTFADKNNATPRSLEKQCSNGPNVTLNWLDATTRLKWYPSGLEIRNDSTSFESVRGTMCVSSGTWYYEVQLVTSGIMQIGWATKSSIFRPDEGVGVGDDDHSFAFDGCRKLAWSSGYPIPYGSGDSWKEGDILGAYIDMNFGVIRYFLNGVNLGVAFQFTDSQLEHFVVHEDGFYPALSLTSFQHVSINFGQKPFRYPPPLPYYVFDKKGKLPDALQQYDVFHRPNVLDTLVIESEDDCDALKCSICVDGLATVEFKPCGHDGFCSKCASILELCPLCRTHIALRKSSELGFTSELKTSFEVKGLRTIVHSYPPCGIP